MVHRTQEQRDRDNFFMDLENWLLGHKWDSRVGVPCGPRRHLDHLWGEVMKTELEDYPRKTYEDYCLWVESGGGDEWFQPDFQSEFQVVVNSVTENGPSEPTKNLRRIGQAGG